MPPADRPSLPSTGAHNPALFLVAEAALNAKDDALREARYEYPNAPNPPAPGPEQVLASPVLLWQVRQQLAGWETGLIETARRMGNRPDRNSPPDGGPA